MSNQVLKGSNTVILYCNTSYSYFNDTGYYSFNLQRSIYNVKSIQLLSYNIPWTWYNVAYYSNIIVFKEGSGSPITTTIPLGNYSETDLQDALETAMTSASGVGATYTVSINYNTMAFSIPSSVGDFTILYSGTTMSSLIGLTADTTSTNKSLTLGTTDLMPIKEIQIRIPHMITNFETSKTNMNQDLLCVASLSGYQFGDIIRENMGSIDTELNVPSISQLALSIVNLDGYTPPFDPNQPLTFSFQITLWS